MTEARAELSVGGRKLAVTNQDKVLWPATGYTKGRMIDYYRSVSEAMIPHLEGRPITLRRWPDGVAGQSFFQKNAPSRRPDWIATVHLGDVDYLRLDEPAALVWAANLASIEIHPGLAQAPHLDRPRAVVFDLDPGPPADVLTCARVAVLLRGYLERLRLRSWVKTSGSKGLQMYVPVGCGADFDATRDFALATAHLASSEHPELVVAEMDKGLRRDRVMVDWAQNAPSRTTVSVYSLRGRPEPTVSTPVTWDEVEDALVRRDRDALRFGPDQVLERIARLGDLMAPVMTVEQELPRRKGGEPRDGDFRS